MGTSDIISIVSTTIAAGTLAISFAQYRASRSRNRTETSRKAEQFRQLSALVTRAAAQAETAKLIANDIASGRSASTTALHGLAEASGKLAEDLSNEAEQARPAHTRHGHP